MVSKLTKLFSYIKFAFLSNICYNCNVFVILENFSNNKTLKEVLIMTFIIIIYILVFAIFALCGYAVMQIKLAGINVKDFWSFIEANQILDKLYVFAKKYRTLSPQQQVVYLMEAEKVFTAFDKIPDIKVDRWMSSSN